MMLYVCFVLLWPRKPLSQAPTEDTTEKRWFTESWGFWEFSSNLAKQKWMSGNFRTYSWHSSNIEYWKDLKCLFSILKYFEDKKPKSSSEVSRNQTYLAAPWLKGWRLCMKLWKLNLDKTQIQRYQLYYNSYLAILCDLFGMVKWPFGKVKWPPNRGSKGHFESPGLFSFVGSCIPLHPCFIHTSGFPQDAVVAALTTRPPAPGPTLPVAKGIPVTEATSIAPGTPTAVAIVASPTPSTGAV